MAQHFKISPEKYDVTWRIIGELMKKLHAKGGIEIGAKTEIDGHPITRLPNEAAFTTQATRAYKVSNMFGCCISLVLDFGVHAVPNDIHQITMEVHTTIKGAVKQIYFVC